MASHRGALVWLAAALVLAACGSTAGERSLAQTQTGTVTLPVPLASVQPTLTTVSPLTVLAPASETQTGVRLVPVGRRLQQAALPVIVAEGTFPATEAAAAGAFQAPQRAPIGTQPTSGRRLQQENAGQLVFVPGIEEAAFAPAPTGRRLLKAA